MPARTINYTNRKRIRREDARITIREDKDEISFDASLHLADYQLPPEACIFVEAYRQTQYMRFDFGRVGASRIPADRALQDYGTADGVLFRVKVVTSDEPHGLLLAEADQIRPKKSTDEDENRIPLLPVKSDDSLEDEIWRIEFDDHQTLLLINAKLGNKNAVARHPLFISLVYPSVVRTILGRILHEDEVRETDNMDNWCSRWLRFASSLPGVGDPPGENEKIHLENWIDNAAKAFCRHNNIRAAYERYSTGAQEQ